MNANPSLFEVGDPPNRALHRSDPRAVVARTRRGDAATAVSAAELVKLGRREMVAAIRNIVAVSGPISAFGIANWAACAFPDRWEEGSVRTCVSAMHHDGLLCHVDNDGRHKGRSVRRYLLNEQETVR